MSFQAYLDTIEEKTGLTPRQLIDIAGTKGFAGGGRQACGEHRDASETLWVDGKATKPA